jgi:hypothetical protein
LPDEIFADFAQFVTQIETEIEQFLNSDLTIVSSLLQSPRDAS